MINFYAPPNKKTEALIALSEKLRQIGHKYSQAQILVAGDFNTLSSNSLITNLKKYNLVSDILASPSGTRGPETLDFFPCKNISNPVHKIGREIGTSDHKYI